MTTQNCAICKGPESDHGVFVNPDKHAFIKECKAEAHVQYREAVEAQDIQAALIINHLTAARAKGSTAAIEMALRDAFDRALFASRQMDAANTALQKHYRTGKGCRTAGLPQ